MVPCMAKKKARSRSTAVKQSERGRLLRRARMVKGLKAQDVADKVGVTAGAVSGWEGGSRKPRATMVPKYAEALGITPNELLDILEKP